MDGGRLEPTALQVPLHLVTATLRGTEDHGSCVEVILDVVLVENVNKKSIFAVLIHDLYYLCDVSVRFKFFSVSDLDLVWTVEEVLSKLPDLLRPCSSEEERMAP